MNYYQSSPSVALAPYIKHYWGIENVYNGDTSYLHRIIPTGLPELIFYLGYKPETSKERVFEDSIILNVQQNDYYDLLIANSIDIFSIYFHPEAVYLFFRLPLNLFLNSGIALNHIDKDMTNELRDKLGGVKSFYQRTAIVESFMTGMLNKAVIDTDFYRMQYIMALISRSGGAISIDYLIDKSCLSRKQFERKFSDRIGISPKQYLKVIRFQSLIHRYNISPDTSLTELAYDSGYYDQSHFINDFKKFTGNSPKRILSECEIISDFFSA